MTREEFILFVDQLRNNIENFENKSLEDFLEAMKRYSEDIDGFYKNQKRDLNTETPTWKIFSEILSGAVVYE